jgi:ferredoxin
MVKVDEKKCIGCGSCEAIAPEAFKMVNGKAKVIGEASEEKINQAINACPVNAISK